MRDPVVDEMRGAPDVVARECRQDLKKLADALPGQQETAGCKVVRQPSRKVWSEKLAP